MFNETIEIKKILSSNKYVKAREYWLENLQEEVLPTELLPDWTLSPHELTDQPVEWSRLSIELKAEVIEALEKLSKGMDLSLYLLLISGLSILLKHYTGQKEIILGSPILKAEQEDGLNRQVILRTRPENTFKETLLAIRNTVLEAYNHQYYPLPKLLELLGITKVPFGISCFYDRLHDQKTALLGEEALIFGFSKETGLLKGTIYYHIEEFSPDKVKQLSLHFQRVLEQVCKNPNCLLSEIEILSATEIEHLLNGLNQTQEDYATDKLIHQLFEEQVIQHPDQIALVFEDNELTYEELNQYANSLAHLLVEKGVKPDQIVGIMTERSLEMVISMLAVLKAGGAYLPLDCEYPAERLEFMLQDSGVQLLLTQKELVKLVHFTGEILDVQLDLLDIHPDNLNLQLNPYNLAYIIYTSGSSGQPKGVLIEHQGIVNLTLSFKKNFMIKQDDRVIQFASCAFDASVSEFYMALLLGASLYLVSKEVILDYEKCERFLNDNQITIATFPPFYLANLNPERVHSLTRVITAGSATNHQLLKRWCERVQYINAYGPTETTICTSVWIADHNHLAYRTVPIGKPIPNLQVLILGDNLELLPIGAVGQICVAGSGLARGYWHRPELTAEKFITNPYNPETKLYLTGDLGRWFIDGNLEFLGRIDQQIKLRGYRIEPEEVAKHILHHPLIREAVVITRADRAGEMNLCAYLVREVAEYSSAELSLSELRELLKKSLPDYMIPTYFVWIEAVPLTVNGKLDYNALPDPEELLEIQENYKKPQSKLEKELYHIWSEVLTIENFGIDQNFFELGGHSLKATQLAAQIYQVLNVELSIMDIFELPTIELLAQKIGQCEQGSFDSIPTVEERDYYPVSSAQKRLYMVWQLEGSNITYNIPGVLTLHNELDIEKLGLVFKKLIARHEAFRTSFEMLGDQLVQRVHRHVDFELEFIPSSEEQISEIIHKFIKPFDLSKAPLFRVGLLELQDRFVLMFDMHHIISDGTSMSILIDELFQLYQNITLPDLRIQYKDYAVWENSQSHQEKVEKNKEFWMQTLEGEVPVLHLPTTYPRPKVMNFMGSGVRFELDTELTTRLKQLAQATDSTLFMVLLTVYLLLLHRYTAQEDIIVGTPIAGRSHADLEKVIGMFVNTLAIRTYPHSTMSFAEFLSQIKETALQAFEHQDYQFELLVEQLGVARNMGRNPLFDTMFALQNIDHSEMMQNNLQMKAEAIELSISKFDLTFNAVEVQDEIKIRIEYRTQLFDKAFIERLAGHYQNLVREVVLQPGTKLSCYQFLSLQEREKLVYEFNDSKENSVDNYPLDRDLVRIFAEQVALNANKEALIFGDQSITYHTLNQKANQVARTLLNQGVSTGQIIGLITTRSVEMIIGILGVLKAGGAYLPIAPDYPLDRINYLLSDSQTEIILTNIDLVDLKDFTGEIINLADAQIYQIDDTPVEVENNPEGLAYVIYTSGTTGKPKGTLTSHKNIRRVVKETNYIQIYPEDRLLQLSNYAFDGSTFDIFGALLNGATLVLVEQETVIEPNSLARVIEDRQITVFFITTALFNLLVETNLTSLTQVRKILFGGERVSVVHVKKAFDLLGEGKLIHVYGPTETTVFATAYPVNAIESWAETIPIGRPITGTQVYVLNSYHELQPIGVAGELCIAGEGLALGYLHQSELTAEKFVQNPLGQGRLYKTGDLATWLADGNIQFLGRLDQQVKIRGFRIEPGEIETALLTHPEIKEAVVLDFEDTNQRKYLCAYLVAEREIVVTELRSYLLQTLPEYMLPTYFMFIAEIPLNANGKVERQALVKPGGVVNTGREYVPPRTEKERLISQIWSDVLHVDRVSTQDNFFELGGDSLKAIQVIARMERLGLQSQVKDLFMYQNLAEFSQYVEYGGHAIMAEQGIIEGEVPLTAIMEWFFTRDFPEVNHWNQSTFLKIPSDVNPEILREAFEHLITHHDSLRLNYSPDTKRLFYQNDYLRQPFELKVIDLAHYTKPEQLQLLHTLGEEIKSGMDLTAGLLLKAALIKLSGNEYRLLITIHHLLIDGVSWRILLEDLADCYSQLSQGKPLQLPVKSNSFKDWAERIGQYSQSEELLSEVSYWVDVENSINANSLNPGTFGEAVIITKSLSQEETKLLLTEVNSAYNTEINDLLLTALARTIPYWSHYTSNVIHLESHGRQEVFADLDILRTVGWFTAVYPVILDLTGIEQISGQIKRIKEHLRNVPNKGFGYRILKYLTQASELTGPDSLEITFNYLGQFDNGGGLFAKAIEDAGPDIGLTNPRSSVLDFGGVIQADKLTMTLTYTPHQVSEAEAHSLLEQYLLELQEIIKHCLSQKHVEFTPADFDLVNLNQDFLDDLVLEFADDDE